MKPKIFKPALLVLMALSALGKPLFAQQVSALPALPAMPKFDTKAFTEGMKQMELGMKDFKMDFKDFGKDFAGSFKGMVPPANFKDHNLRSSVVSKVITDKKVKNYSKSYPVDGNDQLRIDSKYGKVTVSIWNKNEFKVDVQIKVSSGSDSNTQKVLDGITISDGKAGDVVSFETHFGQSNGSGWSIWGNGSSHKVEVDYTIYMPSKNPLDITNKYGATVLPDFDGKLNINSAYGSFDAQALTHVDNAINVRYGSASIESFASGNVGVSYGSLDIGTVDKLDADISYSSVKIGKINSANINARFAGTVKISELGKDFSNLSYNGSYSGLKVGINNTTADFNITVHYGSFSFGDIPVQVTEKTPPDSQKGFSSTQSYKGHIGKSNGDKTISIKSNFGSVQFE